MSTQINLADNKGRNAEVIFKSFTKKPFVKTVTPKGEAKQMKAMRQLHNY
jgi:hypothetical protein